jgi:membrane protein
LWFIATVAFGWYVTRFANYSQVYGSLGAGIALLFWLYIISLCVLYGAEFNTEFYSRFHHPHATHSNPPPPNSLPPV